MKSEVRFGRLVSWIGSTRPGVVTLVVTAYAEGLSALCCFSTYRILGLSMSLSTTAGVIGIAMPLVVPLIAAPLTCLPVARTVRHNVRLLAELERTQVRLEREMKGREALQAQLEAQAFLDPLTGLLNRRGFFQMVARNRRTHSVVLVLDVDGLKPLNDGWGHASGDLVLKTVADVLRSVLGSTASLARLGGDEFAALVVDHGEGELCADVLVQKTRTALARVELALPAGGPSSVSVSVGSASLVAGSSIDAALALADRRMYLHKRGSASGSADRVAGSAGRTGTRASGSG